ncbi:hypothetical protein K9M41_04675 [Candidatus Gracilibacteria bacterium]|nr:hypothetical protein [Candidatus Gracilibacteria bacterium]
MKKVLLIVFALLLLSGCTNNSSTDNKKTILPDEHWRESQMPYSDSVVCALKMTAITEFKEGRIDGELSINEKPMTIAFVDINTEVPSMIGNLGDKEPLTKIDNGTTVYLIEKTGFGNLNVFTLFRDRNIVIMSKQYNLISMPFGMMMMGDCLSGS